MQAKRAREQKKYRVREVSAFKLVGGICTTDSFLQDSGTYDTILNGHMHRCDNCANADKGDITTMPQLVAQMIL